MVAPNNFYLNWAKERLEEMDAFLASLQSQACEVEAGSRAAADRLVADLRKKRDEFRDLINKQADAGDVFWRENIAQLESGWTGFEAEVQKYIETFGQQLDQQQRIFQDAATAQLSAWHDATESFHKAAATFQSSRKADVDAFVTKMKSSASEAEAHFKELRRAGTQSWIALNAALTQSRNAFDHANQAVWDVFKRGSADK